MSTSGCSLCTFETPSGAATRHISLIFVHPYSLSMVRASQELPPVASMGSVTITILSLMSAGSLQ